jgi:hypothetical protein
MKYLVAIFLLAAVIVGVARGGHELPIYPSFYPHEIEIKTLPSAQAADALRAGKLHAYVGSGLSFGGAPPAEVRALESLGAFILVRINPDSALSRDDAAMCAAVKSVVRELSQRPADFVPHPYPVTPWHGDFLYHADLATAVKARHDGGEAPLGAWKVKASGRFARNQPAWSTAGADWDVEIAEIDAVELVMSAAFAVNGWLAPPWLRTGWFHAERLLADAIGDPALERMAASHLRRLKSGEFTGLVERINLERELVAALTAGCRKAVAGFTVKREYVNVEFSAGIENIGFDAIEGLRSPIFMRTVKLKDFPWNGWLMLGTPAEAAAAWNPIGGMTDPFGRLLGSAMTDPALLPSPYEAGWMINRIADIPSTTGR